MLLNQVDIIEVYLKDSLIRTSRHRFPPSNIEHVVEDEQIEEIDIPVASAFLLRYVNLVAIREHSRRWYRSYVGIRQETFYTRTHARVHTGVAVATVVTMAEVFPLRIRILYSLLFHEVRRLREFGLTGNNAFLKGN